MASDLLSWIQNLSGLWQFASLVVQILTLPLITIGLARLLLRRRVRDFSVFLTYSIGNPHPLYPNTINIEVRNLMHAPVVLHRTNFRFARHLSAGKNAHGNSASGDYEVKFRMLDKDGKPESSLSWTMITLRHRECAFAYIPIDDTLTEVDFKAKLDKRWVGKFAIYRPVGWLDLHLVQFDAERPRVTRLKVSVRKGINSSTTVPPLGGDSRPKALSADEQ